MPVETEVQKGWLIKSPPKGAMKVRTGETACVVGAWRAGGRVCGGASTCAQVCMCVRTCVWALALLALTRSDIWCVSDN